MRLLEVVKSIKLFWLYFILILVAPLSNSTLLPRTDVRYMPALLVITVILFIYLLKYRKNLLKKVKKVLDSPTLFLLALLFWGGVTTFFSLDILRSLEFFLGGGLVFIVGYLIVRLEADEEWVKKVFLAFPLVGLIFAAIAFASPIIDIFRPAGSTSLLLIDYSIFKVFTLENIPLLESAITTPTGFGILMVFPLIFSFIFLLCIKNPNLKKILWVAIILCGLGVTLSFTRTAFVTLSIPFLVLAYLFFSRKNYAPVVVISVLLLIFASLSIRSFITARVETGVAKPFIPTEERIAGQKPESSMEEGSDEYQPRISKYGLSGRGILWRASLEWVKSHPIIGSGFGNSPEAISTKMGGEGKRYKGLTPHNTFLRVIVETGVLGIVLYVSFLVSIVGTFLKNRKSVFSREKTFIISVVSLIAGLVALQFFTTLFIFGVGFPSIYFLIIAAASLALLGRANENITRK